MTGRRQRLIVLRRRHDEYRCSQARPEIGHSRDDFGIGFSRGSNNHDAAIEQIGPRIFDTAFFAASQRMTTDKAVVFAAVVASTALTIDSFVLPASVRIARCGAARRGLQNVTGNLGHWRANDDQIGVGDTLVNDL